MLGKKIIISVLYFLCATVYAQSSANKVELQVWANEAIVATYTYNYQDFDQRQKEIAKYFTANGWIAYSKALLDSKLPETIKKNNYYVSAVATAPPEIKNIGTNIFQATMPVLVVYKNPQYSQKQHIKIVINFTNVAKGQGVRGKAISSLKSTEITDVCKCDEK